MDIVMIAAVAENGVIGRDNAMPWRLKSDLQRFRSVTMGRPVIMGRKTFASLGRPLKGRTNIVVSRDPAFSAPGVLVAATIERALEAARGDALRRGVREIVIGGGSHIYAAVMPLATRLDITRVKAHPPGDTTFPPIDPDVWQETGRSEHPAGPDDEAPYAFVSYSRR